MFDFHMHSHFSADCKTPMEEMVQVAIEKGLEKICFTEHIDYEYPDPSITFDLDLPKYDETIKQMQEKYRDDIVIKKGVEIGVQPHLLERYEKTLANETFDFIICSVHTADQKDLHSGDFFKNRTTEESYRIYYKELLYCVKNFKNYSILGHLDLVKRYKKLTTEEDFHEIISEIFKVIIPDGKGIEVNASGFAYDLGFAMPSIDILKLYKEHNGEIITIGSDAHESRHIAHRFSEILDMLQSIGFKYIATFKNLKPEFHSIEKLK